MISATEISPTEPLVITGEVAVGDRVAGLCCQGFAWEVTSIFPDTNPNYTEVWGLCANPDCPDYQQSIGPTDVYRGVSHISVEDLAEWLVGQRKGSEVAS